jgi:hypothetical protein
MPDHNAEVLHNVVLLHFIVPPPLHRATSTHIPPLPPQDPHLCGRRKITSTPSSHHIHIKKPVETTSFIEIFVELHFQEKPEHRVILPPPPHLKFHGALTSLCCLPLASSLGSPGRINTMPDLASRHGYAAATDEEDGGGHGSLVLISCRLGSRDPTRHLALGVRCRGWDLVEQLQQEEEVDKIQDSPSTLRIMG